MSKNWAVIGGGFMGMTLANRLATLGHKVTIFESTSSLGGLAASWELDSVRWDRFYHVILMSDVYTRSIIEEIGLEGDLKWVETKTGFYSNGNLYSMSNLIEFFQFPPINLLDKIRLGLTIFMASRLKNWQKLEQMTVQEWLTKWSGKRVFEKIWLPLLKAKLGDNYKQTSAAFIWATIQRMYAARKSGLKKEMFGYVEGGGYNKIIEAYQNHLESKGVELKFNTRVTSIDRKDQQVLVTDEQDKATRFDSVISTLSSGISASIANGLSDSDTELHNNIRYLGVVCPSVLTNKPLSSYYVTNIIDDWPPFTGIIEMTALVDREEINGKHLIYLPKYLQPHDEMFEWEDEKLRKHFLSALFRMYPELSEDNVEFWGVSSARIVFALPTLDYSTKLPSVRTSLEGYFIINSAQILNGTLNVNETIKVAETKLKEIMDL